MTGEINCCLNDRWAQVRRLVPEGFRMLKFKLH